MSRKDNKKSVKSQEESKSKVNFEELIVNNLQDFKLVQDNSGYHYTTLMLSQKNLDGLSVVFNNYKFLESIDLSQNNIGDFNSLSNLPFLIKLNLERNNIKDLKPLTNEESFKSLKYLYLASNKIVELISIKVQLQTLDLNENKIEKMESFDGSPKLRQFFLKNNKISSLTYFINLPELKELKLNGNKIKQINGIEQLISVTTLYLRNNLIEAFDETFPTLEQLQHLDIRNNKIDKFEEIQKLNILPSLKRLLYKDNPFEQKYPNSLLDTINLMVKLERINNIYITKQLKQKAFAFAEDRYLREQELKRQQEEEERLKQETQQE